MARTPEQKRADEELAIAVDRALEAYGYDSADMLTAHFIVLVDRRGYDQWGRERNSYCTLHKDGDSSWTGTLGLLRAVTLMTERYFIQDHEEG